MAVKVSLVFAENTRWWAILSPVIMKVSKTDFSHTAILLEQGDKKMIYHSEWPMGHELPLSRWEKTYKIKHKFVVRIDEESNVVPQMVFWLKKEVRKPYSVSQLILILIYKMFPYSRFYLHKKIFNGDYKDICTEFLASFIEEFFSYNFTKSDDLIDLNDVFKVGQQLQIKYKDSIVR